MSTVQVHVYDISGGLAERLSQGLLGIKLDGIWHTGVVAYGREFFWGGELQVMEPGTTPFGTPVKTLDYGTTQIPQEVFEDFISSVKDQYTTLTYSVLSNNCNNFTTRALEFLTGNPLSPDIVGLPESILKTPLGMALGPLVMQLEAQMRRLQSAQLQGQSQPGLTLDQILAAQTTGIPARPPQTPAKKAPIEIEKVATPEKEKKPLSTEDGLGKPLLSDQGTASTFLSKILQTKKQPITESETKALSEMVAFASKPRSEAITPPSNEAFAFFEKTLLSWPEVNIFSSVSALRLLILTPAFIQHYIIENPTTLTNIMMRIMECELKPVFLMALATASNIFSSSEGLKFLASSQLLSLFIERAHLVVMDQASDSTFRQMGAALLYNCSIVVNDETSSMIILSAFISLCDEKPTTRDIFGRLILACSILAKSKNEAVSSVIKEQPQLKEKVVSFSEDVIVGEMAKILLKSL
eukprot:TRINITY_DN25255_c0_g1_i1.p1 TRINITY_DN25255_c0_g1~~TRINITY_DN25255_c0_g1_i1.p1  ORF type:complete len:482 (+),score=123.75 TRINITY_DN25255_c0_g1_i1:40-1446(+)